VTGPPPVVFRDLAGPVRVLDAAEQEWLEAHVAGIDPREFTLTLPGARAIADDDELPLVQRHGDGRWTAGRWVGELRIEGRALRIEPRLGFPTLAAWLGAAVNVPVIPRSAGEARGAAVIPQLLAAIWTASVAHAARHARPGIRHERRKVSRTISGRLDVRGTVRLRGRGIDDRVSVRERPRTLEHDLSRVLVRAQLELDRALREHDPEWQRSRLVRELLSELRGAVGPTPELPTERDLARVRYTPITAGYRQAARLSHTIARRHGLIQTSADRRVAGVLLDVAEIWELFLVHCAIKAFGHGAVEHAARSNAPRHLLESSVTGRKLGRLRPDIVITRPGKPLAVLDAKYKRLAASRQRPEGIDRADLYQLTSYLAASPAGSRGALLYPSRATDDLDQETPVAEREGPWRTVSGQHLRFERIPADRSVAAARLTEIVDRPTADQPYAARPTGRPKCKTSQCG
jgi:5-methylcytosine-specific restriction enzyme subunit McrC